MTSIFYKHVMRMKLTTHVIGIVRNKTARIVAWLLFVELLLQSVSFGRYIYYKIIYEDDLSKENETYWWYKDAHYDWWRDESRFLINVYAPYIGWKLKDTETKHISMVGGIRKTEHNPSPLPTSAISVYLFGGSTTWGFLAKNEETIPSFLSLELNKRGIWNIVNYGELGYTSSQSLLKLKSVLLQGNIPDVVVFYDGCNDLRVSTPYGKSIRDAITRGINEKVGNLDDLVRNNPPQNQSIFSGEALKLIIHLMTEYIKIIHYSMQLGRIARTLVAPENYPVHDDVNTAQSLTTAAETMVKEYFLNAHIIESLSRLYGFRYVLVMQPLLTDKMYLNQEERILKDYFDSLGYETVWEEAKEAIRQSNLKNYYDLSGTFKRSETTIFLDRCHITAEGNRVVAEKIRDIIQRVTVGSY